MSKLLFCDYQPNGLGIKLLRLKPGVPSGELGRNQTPGNIGPNPLEKPNPLDVFDEKALEESRNEKEEAAKAALDQTTKLAEISNDDFLTHLKQLKYLIEEATSPQADSSARSVVARTYKLESITHKLVARLSELGQSTNNDLRPAVEALTIRTLINRIYENIQELKKSPSKPMLDNLQLLLMELEYYCPKKQNNRPDEIAQIQNEQLAKAVQDAEELVITIKQRFPVIIVKTAIETVNETIDELAIFSPYDNKSIESFRLKLLNLLQLYYRYFRPYVFRLGKRHPDNELLIAIKQAMDGINSLVKETGYTERHIRQSLMSKPNELKGKLNNLLNELKNQLENKLLPKAEMEINSDNTPFNSLRFGSFRW